MIERIDMKTRGSGRFGLSPRKVTRASSDCVASFRNDQGRDHVLHRPVEKRRDQRHERRLSRGMAGHGRTWMYRTPAALARSP
jgi:hypothetical protein